MLTSKSKDSILPEIPWQTKDAEMQLHNMRAMGVTASTSHKAQIVQKIYTSNGPKRIRLVSCSSHKHGHINKLGVESVSIGGSVGQV